MATQLKPGAPKNQLPPPNQANKANKENYLYIIGGGVDQNVDILKTVQVFDGTSWEKGTDLLTVVSNASYAVYNNKIYIIGGLDENGDRLKTVQVFDGTSWKKGLDLLTAVDNAGCAVINNKIYIIGG